VIHVITWITRVANGRPGWGMAVSCRPGPMSVGLACSL